jgi:hypothetical protein
MLDASKDAIKADVDVTDRACELVVDVTDVFIGQEPAV